MLAASPSPKVDSSPHANSRSSLSPQARYDHLRTASISSSPIVKPHSSHVDAAPQPTPAPPQWSRHSYSGSSAPASVPTPHSSRPNMVDVGTQYSPPPGYRSSPPPRKIVASEISRLQLVDPPAPQPSSPDAAMSAASPLVAQPPQEPLDARLPISKRQISRPKEESPPDVQIAETQKATGLDQGPSKRVRGESPPTVVMPLKYETCDTRELVILISSMLMELIRYNDAIPLRDGALTRFHSRAPPGISVLDYLQRLTTHATLSPPILLSMVYYIDKLCALYPAFTISSLTVHRFLITSATVASKGLSDSFWTNKTYARVGGVSIKELATLELEFLGRVQWRIVPKPEVLIDYYRSLVERSPGYELEVEAS